MEGQYEFILQRASVQFEPDDPEFIRVSERANLIAIVASIQPDKSGSNTALCTNPDNQLWLY